MKNLMSSLLIVVMLFSNINFILAEENISNSNPNAESLAELWFSEKENKITDGNVSDVLKQYFEYREKSFFNNIELASIDEDKFSFDKTIIFDEEKRKEYISKMEERMNINIVNAKITYNIENEEIQNDSIILNVYEWTFFDYDDLEDDIYAEDTSGYGIHHIITFKNSDGKYILVSDKYDESDMLGMKSSSYTEKIYNNKLDDLSLREFLESDEDNINLDTYSGYNPDAAAAYSDQYALNYNTSYKNYANSGGDCANFVSQCLLAGGLPTSSSWKAYTSAWISAGGLKNYLVNTYGGLVSPAKESDIKKGNPVFYPSSYANSGWHATICAGYNSSGSPIINSHTENVYHVKYTYFAKEGSPATIQLSNGGNNPEGYLDALSGGNGVVKVNGWALDKDNKSEAIQIHVYIGGPAGVGEGYPIYANVDRPDVGKHGFDFAIPTYQSGNLDVYVYAINIGSGENVLLGSGTVKVTPMTHTVAYNANGGTGAPASQSKTVNKQLFLSTQKPTRLAYNFVNWKATINGKQVTFNPGDNYTPDQPGGTVTLYAQWTPYKHTVAYNANGGTGAPASQTKTADVKLNLSTQKPTRTGYNFVNWKATINGKSVTYNPGDNYKPDQNGGTVTLYAQWKEDPNYDKTPPVISNIKIKKDTTGYTITCKVTDNKKVNRVQFPTWTTANDQDDIIKDWITNSKASGTKNGDIYTYRVNYSDHKNERGFYNTHIYAYDDYGNSSAAKANGGTYNTGPVIYNANGGKGAPENQTKVYDVDLVLSNVKPTRPGYIFMGWGKSADTTSVVYQPGGTYKENVGNTLYAIWKKNFADLGDNFKAKIIQTSSGRLFTTDGSNVVINPATGYANQSWNFTKNSDGSYKIKSVSNNGTIDVLNAKIENGTNIQLLSQDKGNNAQKWFICKSGDSYMFVSALDASKVIDIYGSTTDKTSKSNVQLWARNDSNTQKFKIEKITTQAPDQYTINVSNTNTYLYEKITVNYSVKNNAACNGILCVADSSGEVYKRYNIGTNKSIDITFDKTGTYSLYFELSNEAGICNGAVDKNDIKVTVNSKTPQKPADTNDIILNIGNNTGKAGGYVDIPIKIENNKGISSFNVIVMYDNSIMYPVSYVKGSEFSDMISTLDSEANMTKLKEVKFVWDNLNNVTNDCELFTVKFKINDSISNGRYPINVNSSSTIFTNSKLEDVEYTAISGNINVSDILKGDVNNDGKINGKDVVLMRQYTAGWPSADLTPEQVEAGDVTGDGLINGKDIVKIRQYIAGWSDISL